MNEQRPPLRTSKRASIKPTFTGVPYGDTVLCTGGVPNDQDSPSCVALGEDGVPRHIIDAQLAAAIPVAAKMLKTTVSKLEIRSSSLLNMLDIHGSSLRDSCIQKRAIPGYPMTIISANRAPTIIRGRHLSMFETRTDSQLKKPIRYVSIETSQEDAHRHTYYVNIRGTAWRLCRYFVRTMKLAALLTPQPKIILAPGMWDDIRKFSIDLISKRRRMKEYGCFLRTGMIFSGDPGNGKTSTCKLIRSICQREGIRSHDISNSEILTAISLGNLPELVNQSGVQFYDDINLSFLQRRNTSGSDSGSACELLAAMDGMSGEDSFVIRIFCTNEDTSELDTAFMRPGRIDRVFCFDAPTAEMRLEYFHTWHVDLLKQIPDLKTAVKQTDELSFAEIHLIRRMMVNSIMLGNKCDFDEALDMCLNGRQTTKHQSLGFAAAG